MITAKDTRWLVVIAGLVATGALLRGVSGGLVARAASTQPEWRRTEALMRSAGPQLALGVLGGFRALAADFLWLQVQDRWERRDLSGTLGHLRLATTVDPRPLTFWLNGARIIAYDMPEWRLARRRGDPPASARMQRQVETEQAEAALAWLREGQRFHPRAPALLIERANVQLNRLHDLTAAAASYRSAAELPGAPYYAARLHAELLKHLGRKAEAYAWLRKIHPILPPQDEAAAAGLVLARLRALEDELAVPTGERYRASGTAQPNPF